MLHDVLHVAPFPPQPWMEYITHPFADLLTCGWQDIMLEHKRHHVATADVLHHGEFGWDPSEVQYFFQEYSTWTAPLCYFIQCIGFYDTGMEEDTRPLTVRVQELLQHLTRSLGGRGRQRVQAGKKP